MAVSRSALLGLQVFGAFVCPPTVPVMLCHALLMHACIGVMILFSFALQGCLSGGLCCGPSPRRQFLQAAAAGENEQALASLQQRPSLCKSTTWLKKKTALHLAAEEVPRQTAPYQGNGLLLALPDAPPPSVRRAT